MCGLTLDPMRAFSLQAAHEARLVRRPQADGAKGTAEAKKAARNSGKLSLIVLRQRVSVTGHFEKVLAAAPARAQPQPAAKFSDSLLESKTCRGPRLSIESCSSHSEARYLVSASRSLSQRLRPGRPQSSGVSDLDIHLRDVYVVR